MFLYYLFFICIISTVSGYTQLSPEDVILKLQNKEFDFLLDVRTLEEYNKIRLEGAYNVNKLVKDENVHWNVGLIGCSSASIGVYSWNDPTLSETNANLLTELNFANVYDLGAVSWALALPNENGIATASGEPEKKRGSCRPECAKKPDKPGKHGDRPPHDGEKPPPHHDGHHGGHDDDGRSRHHHDGEGQNHSSSSESKDHYAGARIFKLLGAVAFIGFIVTLICCCCKKRKQRRNVQTGEVTQPSHSIQNASAPTHSVTRQHYPAVNNNYPTVNNHYPAVNNHGRRNSQTPMIYSNQNETRNFYTETIGNNQPVSINVQPQRNVFEGTRGTGQQTYAQTIQAP